MNTDGAPSLADVFASRPERFRMLERGMRLAGWDNHTLILEIGCGRADGGAYLAEQLGARVIAMDVDPASFSQTRRRHAFFCANHSLCLLRADAHALPFMPGCFDGIFSEAAFSPLSHKKTALRQYHTALKPGGRLLINDFCVQSQKDKDACEALAHIPCFSGVNTMERYRLLCERAGFTMLHAAEDYGEMIRLALCLSKAYGIKIQDIGPYLSGYYHTGASRCKGADTGCRERFHEQAHLSYCQMLFVKE